MAGRKKTIRYQGTVTAMLDLLAEPFTYPFMLRGMLAAILAGALCGGIGVYIILKRMAYIGHGLSHAVLGGAVVSFVHVVQLPDRLDGMGISLRPAHHPDDQEAKNRL